MSLRINLLRTIALATALAVPFAPAAFAQDSIRVEVVKTSDGWQMVRGGKPYFIKGVGGEASKQLLVQYGGNSFRTWGADRLATELEEAQKLGLTVTAGMWLGHKRHGFDYHNAQQVKAQFEKAREIVLSYRNHPALLMWAIGNEMESDQPAGSVNIVPAAVACGKSWSAGAVVSARPSEGRARISASASASGACRNMTASMECDLARARGQPPETTPRGRRAARRACVPARGA